MSNIVEAFKETIEKNTPSDDKILKNSISVKITRTVATDNPFCETEISFKWKEENKQ